jgi:hypothetical protein
VSVDSSVARKTALSLRSREFAPVHPHPGTQCFFRTHEKLASDPLVIVSFAAVVADQGGDAFYDKRRTASAGRNRGLAGASFTVLADDAPLYLLLQNLVPRPDNSPQMMFLDEVGGDDDLAGIRHWIGAGA